MSAFTTPVVSPLYGPLPYAYRGCPQLVVVFRSTARSTARLVPPPLVANEDDLMFVMIGEMHSDEFGTNREAFVAVPVTLGDLRGNFAVVLYLDDVAAVASGREVWGWPKKDASLTRLATDRLVSASASRGGVELIDARLDVAGPAGPDDLRLDPTWFNLKLIPSVEEGAPPDVHQITATTLQNVRIHDPVAGAATLRFGDGPADPLAELIDVREVLGGVAFGLDCDLTLGRVVHDHLALARSGEPLPVPASG
jgi:acetoacetate decarboxylase